MKFILPLILLFSSLAGAQSGVSASYIKMTPTSLPSTCSLGTLRFDSSAHTLNYCGASNNWSSIGSTVWGTITGTLSSQTDLNTALGLKAPLASPTFSGTVTTPLSSGIVSSASGVLGTTALSGDVTSSGFATTVVKINGTSLASLGTGILKNTTTTGVPSIAIAADFPTLNQNTSGTASNITGSTNSTLTTLSALTSVGAIATGTWNATTVAIAHGGTAVTSVTTAPSATSFAGWDANKNISANATIDGFTTTATAAGTTVMTIASAKTQYWTGVTTQNVKLPTTSVVAGAQYYIQNLSTGVVTVQSSGANTIVTLSQNTGALFTALIATPTTAANWDFEMTPSPVGSSSGNLWTSTGASSAPTWQAPSGTSPTGSYAQAYFSSLTVQWSTVSATMADFTLAAGANTLTVRKSSGITLTAAASSLPGITFTPASSSAVYWVTASAAFANSTTANYLTLQLTDGSQIIASNPGINSGNTNADSGSTTIGGVYVPGTASAVTVKIQGAINAGTGFLGVQNAGALAGSAAIEWTVVRIF